MDRELYRLAAGSWKWQRKIVKKKSVTNTANNCVRLIDKNGQNIKVIKNA